MEEAALINDLIYRIELVSHCPVDRLRSQSLGIERLNTMTNDLYRTVRSEEQINGTLDPVPTPRLSRNPEHISSNDKVHRSRHVSADAVLLTAKSSAVSLGNLLEQESNFLAVLLLPEQCDWRLAHLQPIFLLQRTGGSLRSKAEDRIFLLCSCLSLAREFQTYEESLGQISRHDTSICRILSGEDVAIQQNGKHFQGFLTTLKHQAVHKGKFDAGLRLGIKLSLIETIGAKLGIGSGLSLVAGYECNKLARMSYREITRLFILLKNNHDGEFNTIRACCAELGEKWSQFHHNYHLRQSALEVMAESVMISQSSSGSPKRARNHSGLSRRSSVTIAGELQADIPASSSAHIPRMWSARQEDSSWFNDDVLSSLPQSEGYNTADDHMTIDLLNLDSLPSDLNFPTFL
nr:hypothetical protein CFP56_16719 [Quercus suber]